jgi:hypothetical protein
MNRIVHAKAARPGDGMETELVFANRSEDLRLCRRGKRVDVATFLRTVRLAGDGR